MKKIMIGILSLVLVSLLSVGVFGKTDVVGIVYEEDHKTPVDEASVNVKCYNGDTLTGEKDTTTEDDGAYGVEFYVSECGNGDTVIVYAEKEGVGSGSDTGIVHDFGLEVYLAIVNPAIPEFTIITAGIALTGALFGLSIFRKHKGE